MFKKFIVGKDYQDTRFDKWFKQNVNINDLNNMIYFYDELVAYTSIRFNDKIQIKNSKKKTLRGARHGWRAPGVLGQPCSGPCGRPGGGSDGDDCCA